MTKKELRKIYKEKRLALSHQQKLKIDDLLLIRFQRLHFDYDVQLLLSYFPLSVHAEIDPHLFSDNMRLHLPHLQVAYPVIDPLEHSMQAFLVDDDTTMGVNVYGIEEPIGGAAVAASDVDVVFVPLLAFDEQGYRVGYGKGYYDRYLYSCRKDVITIGFSYFEAVGKIDDKNQFDIPLNYCITPQQLYEF